MIKKVLIANRSEIACRIIRACREMDIRTVAVYSEADANALHVEMADEAYLIGPAPAKESYLDMDKIIETALMCGADAIHPGYGFLSERHAFIEKVTAAGLVFIGPNAEAVKLLGSKTESRTLMLEKGVPVIPGMKSSSDKLGLFKEAAIKTGYPVLIKAAAGGGGKGMRIVREEQDLEEAVASAQREALAAFGSGEVFLEKYIEKPRHIEFQVAADKYGNYIHLFERECSVQRRHQKVIEETPSVALNPALREKMGEAAVNAVKAAGYDSVGTVEFLLDGNGDFYFLEVNTRIQVEHPITEAVTGIDLLKLQIRLAQGERLGLKQEELSQRGHAIECRIYAEDGDNNFMPSSGMILFHRIPAGPGIRYDSGIRAGDEVSVFYDPILAKLIVWDETRESARRKMISALKEHCILGVATSTGFMIRTLENENFIKGGTYTDFIEKNADALFRSGTDNKEYALAVAAMPGKTVSGVLSGSKKEGASPWQTSGNWEIAKQ